MNELIWRAQSGDKWAMSKIVDENIGLVWNIVKRFNNRGYEMEDLFQLGCIGFVKAIQRFNTDYETQLSTYAVPMIIGEIKRFLRDNGAIKVSRSLKELATKVRILQDEESKKGNDEISLLKIAEKLKVSKEDVIVALDATSYIESLDRKINEDDKLDFSNTVIVDKNEYNEILDKILLGKTLENLDEIERKIIIYRYYKEKTQCEIANIFNISQVQVSRIEKRALLKMRELMV